MFQLSVLDQRLLDVRLGSVSGHVMEAIWAAFDEITERQVAG